MNESVPPILRSDILRLVRQVQDMARSQRARHVTLVVGVPDGVHSGAVRERIGEELEKAGLLDVLVSVQEGARALQIQLIEFAR
jgi:hypothetical protein